MSDKTTNTTDDKEGSTMASITTEDGTELERGASAFNYYDQKVGRMLEEPDAAGWVRFSHDDGTAATLNGARLCSLEFAVSRGWISSGELELEAGESDKAGR